jgi:hypothetical protein
VLDHLNGSGFLRSPALHSKNRARDFREQQDRREPFGAASFRAAPAGSWAVGIWFFEVNERILSRRGKIDK